MAWIAMTNEDGTKSLIHSDLCDDYLAHHGVKGQKWGVIRYQNKSGTKKHKRASSKKSGTKKHKRASSKKSGKQRKANSKVANRSKLYKDRGALNWHLQQELQNNLQRMQMQMMQDQMRQQQEQQNQMIQQQNQMMQDQIWQQQEQINDSFPMFF